MYFLALAAANQAFSKTRELPVFQRYSCQILNWNLISIHRSWTSDHCTRTLVPAVLVLPTPAAPVHVARFAGT